MGTDHLTFIRKNGSQIESVFESLGALRIQVFKDFPYLYEGSLDYEIAYLQTYAKSERAFLFAVYDGSEMVGATTCLPLKDETKEVREPFAKAQLDLDSVFYFGESILLPGYRGLGLGHRFFDEREAHAASFNQYQYTCFCAVDRPDNHPSRPDDYRPNDVFWLKRGYKKNETLKSIFEWPDSGETDSTPKSMTYWMKTL